MNGLHDAGLLISERQTHEYILSLLELFDVTCSELAGRGVVICDLAGAKELVRRGVFGVKVILVAGCGEDIPAEVSDVLDVISGGENNVIRRPIIISEFHRVLRLALLPTDITDGNRTVKASSAAVDSEARTVTFDGKTVRLSAKEFALFSCLMSREGAPVPRDDIINSVWYGTHGADNRVDVYISYLRAKLSPLFGDCVLTYARGRGYILSLHT